MNKLTNIVLAGVSVLALSACGGGSDGDSGGNGGGGNGGGNTNPPQSYNQVDVLDLTVGYIIDGYNEAGENVSLEYCNGSYNYYSGGGSWYGNYNINGDRINMFDNTPTGGSYKIDTLNNLLEVGRSYSIDFQNDEIIVENIREDLGC